MSQAAVKNALKNKKINKKCGNMLYFAPALENPNVDYFIQLPMPQTMTVWVDPQTNKFSIGQGVCLQMQYANENFTYIFCHIGGVRIIGRSRIQIITFSLFRKQTTGSCKDGILFAVKQGEEYIDAYNFINL